jgi:DNA-binding NarL/FixJ family response regulator
MRARILIGEMPRMMHDIVGGAVESQADMEIVGHCANRELKAAIRRYGANVIVLEEDTASAHDLHKQCLLTYPDLKVIVMTGDGRRATLFELRHLDLIEPSPVVLIDAIRAAVHHDIDETTQHPGE